MKYLTDFAMCIDWLSVVCAGSKLKPAPTPKRHCAHPVPNAPSWALRSTWPRAHRAANCARGRSHSVAAQRVCPAAGRSLASSR